MTDPGRRMLVHRHLLIGSHVFANDADPLVLDFQMVVLRIGHQRVERLCTRQAPPEPSPGKEYAFAVSIYHWYRYDRLGVIFVRRSASRLNVAFAVTFLRELAKARPCEWASLDAILTAGT